MGLKVMWFFLSFFLSFFFFFFSLNMKISEVLSIQPDWGWRVQRI